MKKTFVIGHRGWMGKYPENTLKSFSKAISMGVDAIELDVRLSSDGHIVVFHDEKVDRITNGKGFVKDLTLKELKKLKIKSERICTLQEVFDLVKGRVIIDIEIKCDDIEDQLVCLIEDNILVGNVIISSFDKKHLIEVKNTNCLIKCGLLYYGKIKEEIEICEKHGFELFLPNYKFVTKKIISEVHKLNKKIIVWNLDSKKLIEEMVKLDVDGIASDYPDLVVKVLHKM